MTRNRLTKVTHKNAAGQVTKTVDYSYDLFDRRVSRVLDPDGQLGSQPLVSDKYVYDGQHIALQFNGSNTLTHRYLHAGLSRTLRRMG